MKIAVAISGGVDSLYAAHLLKKEGHHVIAVYMILHRPNLKEDQLKTLLKTIGVQDLHIIDFSGPFEKQVIQPFLEAYTKGITPNPCILCNDKIKFGLLLEYVQQKLNVDKLATGHYAEIVGSPYLKGRLAIKKASDNQKDQSYFLYPLSPARLKHILFPLAHSQKSDAIKWAKDTGIDSLICGESQEICFVSNRKYTEFMESRLPISLLKPGPIKTLKGQIMGYHKGIYHYTIGQRRGLGISFSEPLYVVRIEPETNTVFVGRKEDVFGKTCYVDSIIWGAIKPNAGSALECYVKIRQQHRPAKANIHVTNKSSAIVFFETPQAAITPGQAAVFYDRNGLILGGGTITTEISKSGD